MYYRNGIDGWRSRYKWNVRTWNHFINKRRWRESELNPIQLLFSRLFIDHFRLHRREGSKIHVTQVLLTWTADPNLRVFSSSSMEAHLSELQKMLCKISEASNVNQSRVEPYTGVSNLSDSKGHTQNITKGHKKLSQRRKHLKTSLTYNTRAQNEKYIKKKLL